MKKLFSGLIALTLFFSIGTSVFADTSGANLSSVDITTLIDNTNNQIESDIADSVKAGDALQQQYVHDIGVILYGDDYDKLESEKAQALEDLSNATTVDETNAAQANLDAIQAKLDSVQSQAGSLIDKVNSVIDPAMENLATLDASDVSSIESQLTALLDSQDPNTSQYVDRTVQYVQDLNNLIGQLNQETLDLVNGLIQQTSGSGVTIEQYWIPVTIAGRTVMIDPIKIVGLY